MATTKKYVSLDKLNLYDEKIKKVITDGDAASLKSAKDYADSLASNYDAAGASAGVQAKLDEEVVRAKAAEEANAASAKKAQDEVDALELVVAEKAAQSDLDALETYVGEIPVVEGEETPSTIVAYVQKKTSGIATSDNLAELTERVAQAETDIDNIEKDYLKAADKTELEGKITNAQTAADNAQNAVNELAGTHATDKTALEGAIALKADQTALDAVSAVANAAVKQSDYDVKVKALEDEDARIAGLVEAEATKAREEEGKLSGRLEEVEAFFKLAEGEQLDTALDTLKEIQVYVTTEGAAADQMVLDIAANAKAIEDHVTKVDHDFTTADATLQATLEAEIAKKADKTTVEGIDGRVTTAEGKITTIEGKLADIEESADANVIEVVKVNGETLTVTDKAVDITVPTGALAGKDKVAETDLEEVLATKLNAKADKSALDEAVEALEGADDSIKGRLDALEAIDHEHANKAELDLIASGDKAKWDVAEAKAHEHANKAELDKFVDGDKAKLDDAYAKAHVHENANVINGITAENITTWNTVTSKAAQTDLDNAVERIAANETAIAAFVEVSEEEINALFA